MLQAAYDKQVIERKALVKSVLTSMLPERIIHDHTLRVLQPVKNNKSSYDFPIIKGIQNTNPGEMLLTNQDAFALVGIRPIVAKGKTNGNTYMVNGIPFQSYVDPIVFRGAAAGSAAAGGATAPAYLEAEAMENFFTGYFDLKESSTEIVYKLDTRKLRYLPARGVDVNAEMPSVRLLPVQERINEDNGMYLLGKEVLFHGKQDINAYFNIEGAADLGQVEAPFPTAETNVFGFELHGFLIRGGADLDCVRKLTMNGVNNLCRPEMVEEAANA